MNMAGKKKNTINTAVNLEKRILSLISSLKNGQKAKKKKNKNKKKKSMDNQPGRVFGNVANNNDIGTSYLTTLIHPTDRSNPSVGIPTYPTTPSQKVTVHTTFSISTGTQGFGFFAFNPAISNDSYQFSYSTNTWEGNTIPTLNTEATGIQRGVMALPYTASQFGQLLQARVVSCGFRAVNTTNSFTAQGMMHSVCPTNHLDISGYNELNLSRFKDCVIAPARTGAIMSGHLSPSKPANLQYATTMRPFSDNAAIALGGILLSGAQVTSGNTAAMTFQVHYSLTVEYTGRTADGVSTPNPIPPVGLVEHVSEVTTAVATMHSAVPHAHPSHKLEVAKTMLNAVRRSSLGVEAENNLKRVLTAKLATMAGMAAVAV